MGTEAVSAAFMPTVRVSLLSLRLTFLGFFATVTLQVAVLPPAAVTVMVAEPAFTPVITPVVAFTLATFLFLEDHLIHVAQVVESEGGVSLALSPSYFSPTPMDTLDRFVFTDLGATSTDTVQRATRPLCVVAVTMAWPLRTPLTEPVAASSLMQPASGEVSSMAKVMLAGVVSPAAVFAVVFRVTFCFGAMERLSAENARLAGALVTVTLQVAVLPL